jgi:hypothetical protein
MIEGYVVYVNDKSGFMRKFKAGADPFYAVDMTDVVETLGKKYDEDPLNFMWRPAGRGDECIIYEDQIIAKAVRVTFQPVGAFCLK